RRPPISSPTSLGLTSMTSSSWATDSTSTTSTATGPTSPNFGRSCTSDDRRDPTEAAAECSAVRLARRAGVYGRAGGGCGAGAPARRRRDRHLRDQAFAVVHRAGQPPLDCDDRADLGGRVVVTTADQSHTAAYAARGRHSAGAACVGDDAMEYAAVCP